MTMFEWLEEEILSIKTPRFHVVDGPADAKLVEAVIRTGVAVPSAYKDFVLKFGNAKLYRNTRNDSYHVVVLAGPREVVLKNGTRAFVIGFRDGASVYVKDLPSSTRIPIFERESDSEEMAADSFDEWLLASCAFARRTYGDARWAEILRGPKPFSVEEKEIIETRRSMRWKVIGIDSDGNHIFEITNAGRRVLAALTVGVRSKDGRLNGAIRLDTRSVIPGQSAKLHAGCYKGIVQPEDLQIFELPDPKPEDRDYYWEFKQPL